MIMSLKQALKIALNSQLKKKFRLLIKKHKGFLLMIKFSMRSCHKNMYTSILRLISWKACLKDIMGRYLLMAKQDVERHILCKVRRKNKIKGSFLVHLIILQILQVTFIVEKNKDYQYLVHCQYVEIYNEGIYDLVDSHQKYDLKECMEEGFYVKNLKKNIIHNIQELYAIFEKGNKNRSTNSTSLNEKSSRSHSIFSLTIEIMNQEKKIKAGKLNLVDLAGSEKISKSQVKDQQLKETQKINQSLAALGNVIFALSDNKIHIPFRDSKLTKLLQNSLGGNSKTIMIAVISPSAYNYEETLNTLRYASRANIIQNKPVVNLDPKEAIIMKYQSQISELKSQLQAEKLKNNMVINNNYSIQYNQQEINNSTTNFFQESTNKSKIEMLKQKHSQMLQSQGLYIQQLEDETEQKMESIQNNQKQVKLDNLLKIMQDSFVHDNNVQEMSLEIDNSEKKFQNQQIKQRFAKTKEKYQNEQQQIIKLNDIITNLERENVFKETVINSLISKQEYNYLKNNCVWEGEKVELPKNNFLPQIKERKQQYKSVNVIQQSQKTNNSVQQPLTQPNVDKYINNIIKISKPMKRSKQQLNPIDNKQHSLNY